MYWNVEAISGVCGSISIACWVVVFSPQIIENFRRSSAEGLSIVFLVIWLAGDVFNILGAVLQGVLPTMIILAVYYTLADIVLILQCFYYRGFTLKDEVRPPPQQPQPEPEANERTALLANNDQSESSQSPTSSRRRRHSSGFPEIFTEVDGTHLSPATPLHHPTKRDEAALQAQSPVQTRSSWLKAALFNATAIVVVCAAGALGWWLSTRTKRHNHYQHEPPASHSTDELRFNVLGQVFGYICALLYLGSRLPQLLLNYRRKSTEGISMLFFMFACIGNLTYVLSILAYEPYCGSHGCGEREFKRIYGRNLLVNFSWLLGSFGTLILDAFVFAQYFWYRKPDDDVVVVITDT